MNHADADLVAGFQRLEDAIEELERKPSSAEGREMVCIETRAVYSVFEDVTYWAGELDTNIQKEIVKKFDLATELMSVEQDDLFCAVQKRRDAIRDFELVKVPLTLNAR